MEAHRRLLRKLKGLLGHLGCHQRRSRARRSSTSASRWPASRTSAAPLRFGTDPRESVLDVDCKAHDLDNLYVVDTSFFPSSSAVNPALTAMANALRVGDHLLDRLGARVEAAVNGKGDLELQETA